MTLTDFFASLFRALSPLWEMSLTAAYVTAVVVLLRLFLKRRAPKQVLCLLWLVVFARLLVPASLESPLSLIPGEEQVQRAQDLSSRLMGGPAPNFVQNSGPVPTYDPALYPAVGLPPDVLVDLGSQEAPVPDASPQPEVFRQAVLAAVWLAGAAAMGVYGLTSCLRLKRRLYDAIRAEDGAWEHPSVRSPFILGILRPRIYLPAGLWGMSRQFILCHERAHLRRLDHIVKPVCWIALALHWFNPAVWIAFLLMSRDIEAACDEAVIRQLGPRVKADYSATLLSLATNGRVPAPSPLAFDEGNAKGRIQNVLRYRRPALWIMVVSAVMAVLAAVCLLTDPVTAQADPDPSASLAQGERSPTPEISAAGGLNDLLDPWMEEVLNGERLFRRPYGAPEDFSIRQLRAMVYGDEELPRLTLEVGRLAIIDLDRDGVNEMVVWPVDTLGERDDPTEIGYYTGYFIFRRQGDMVCADYPGWRSIGSLKADGTFDWSGSAFEWGTGRARFNNGVFEIEQITWRDGMETETYFVNGLSTAREEFEAAWAAHQAKPEPTWYVFEDGLLKYASIHVPIPLDDHAMTVSVPDFLDADQQLLYRQMYMMYTKLFGATSASADYWPGNPGSHGSIEPVDYNGSRYWPATGLYAKWSDFEQAVLSVFTEEFWKSKNERETYTTYINIGGTMHYLDWARGSGGYNENFPETFRLVEQTSDTISFIMTGYYSDDRQFNGVTDEQREAWLAAGWENSIEFPMRMVRTENGWRFDEFHNARTDNVFFQEISNPNAPVMDGLPELDPNAEVCVHGFDHVYVSTLDGTSNSRKIYQAHNTSMIYRCLEDGFTYIVPAPITGRDYWFGGGAEDDFDGDGRAEEAILQENARLIMVCDAEDGLLRTCAVDTGSMIDAFNQDLSYNWTDDGQTMAIDLSFQGRRIQAQFTGRERDLILSYGDQIVPTAADWNGYLAPFSGQDIILGLPIYLTGSANGGSTVALGGVEWTYRYGGGEITYVPGSLQLTADPSVDLPVSWIA